MTTFGERAVSSEDRDILIPDEERLASLAQFCAAAGHEINNPLAVILGRVHLLLANEHDPNRRQSLETIAGQAHRIRDMIGDVMLFADPPIPVPSEVNLPTLLQEVIDRQIDSARKQHPQLPEVSTEWDSEEVCIQADQSMTSVIFGELIRNALHPTAKTQRVSVSLVSLRPEEGAGTMVEIRDDGQGLSEEERQHLFDPFYSGRQAGRGLGFGLSKAYQFAALHGAKLSVASNPAPERGLCFRVLWPAGSPH